MAAPFPHFMFFKRTPLAMRRAPLFIMGLSEIYDEREGSGEAGRVSGGGTGSKFRRMVAGLVVERARRESRV